MIKVLDSAFIQENGQIWKPVGYTADAEAFERLTDAQLAQLFTTFTAYGGTVFRVLFGDTAKGVRIESAAGVIDPSLRFERWMNRMLLLCELYNVRLVIGVWSWWSTYYRSFFSQESIQKQRVVLDYLITNWRTNDKIFAWELYNEVNGDSTEVNYWIASTAYAFSSLTKQLCCISATNCRLGTPASQIWTNTNLSFAAAHAYDIFGSYGLTWSSFSRRLQNVTAIMQEVKNKTAAKPKPFLDTEIPGVPTNFFTKLFCGNLSSNEQYAQSFLAVGKSYMQNGAAGPGLSYCCNPAATVDGVPSGLTQRLLEMQKQF